MDNWVNNVARPGSSIVGRDAFKRMMAHFRAPGCNEAGLVIWKYSRFARDVDDAQFAELSSNLIASLDQMNRDELRSFLRSRLNKIIAERDGKTIRGIIHYYLPSLEHKTPSGTGNPDGASSNTYSVCPHGDSNPGFRLERPTSWSPRRWGQIFYPAQIVSHSTPLAREGRGG